MPIDYSKWDNITCSDSDSDAERLPRVIRIQDNQQVSLDKSGYSIKTRDESIFSNSIGNSKPTNVYKLWSKRVSNGLVYPKSHLFSQDKYTVACLIALDYKPKGPLLVEITEESLKIKHNDNLLFSKEWYGRIKENEEFHNWQLVSLDIDWSALSDFVSLRINQNPQTELFFNNIETRWFVEIEVHKINDIPDSFFWWPKLFKSDNLEIKRKQDPKFKQIWEEAHEEFRKRVAEREPLQI
ncbi:HSP20-like chaperone [Babesia duncani]|uniref:HSP20-like chaperone n=1 Tax=Babesia duncani TaxID=323732 RepID=A0AAD9UQ51_9APIC|nr:HSP20-like chaperone [Babesia duncani]